MVESSYGILFSQRPKPHLEKEYTMTSEFYGQELKSLRFCLFGSTWQSRFRNKVQWKCRNQLQGHLHSQSYQKKTVDPERL